MAGRPSHRGPRDSRWEEMETLDSRGRVCIRSRPRDGSRFGSLTITAVELQRVQGKKSYWASVCLCDCGRSYEALHKLLAKGQGLSCGSCGYKKGGSDRRKRNPLSAIFKHRSDLYNSWSARYTSMLSRCLDPSNPDWGRYGGRGIKVFQPWVEDRALFFQHVVELPNFGAEGFQLDRIDNDGNYEPGNVRLVSRSRNIRNRSTPTIAYQGFDWNYSDFRERFTPEWNYSSLHYHLASGRDAEEIIRYYSTYLRHRGRRTEAPLLHSD